MNRRNLFKSFIGLLAAPLLPLEGLGIGKKKEPMQFQIHHFGVHHNGSDLHVKHNETYYMTEGSYVTNCNIIIHNSEKRLCHPFIWNKRIGGGYMHNCVTKEANGGIIMNEWPMPEGCMAIGVCRFPYEKNIP